MNASSEKSFLSHAKLIAAITFVSRLLGYAREKAAAHFFGPSALWDAFVYAFTIPNLFRKLLGEGALSQAFIPLYAKAVKADSSPSPVAPEEGRDEGQTPKPLAAHRDRGPESAADFATASVNLLMLLTTLVTLAGEALLFSLLLLPGWSDASRLAILLTALMLPYVTLVCGAAFLSGILQVHKRFAAPAATAIVLNLMQIIAMALLAWRYDLRTEEGQRIAIWWLAACVLASGFAQVAILLPGLYVCGFRFRLVRNFWTPRVKQMLKLSIPVAIGAGVLQIGVLMDRQISFMLAAREGDPTFTLLGYEIAYPFEAGVVTRLNWAQFMYQFPLGVFAIAIATAIFPKLSEDAGGSRELRVASREGPSLAMFRDTLRRGIEAALFIGLPASAGMVVVAMPATRLLFEGGETTLAHAKWIALSTAIYSAAIWAFSVQQILNRGYYALHDAKTPLIWTTINLLLNLVIEIPLAFTSLGESAMAVGTLGSFAIQTTFMTALLCRRVGLDVRPLLGTALKMLIATALMTLACVGVRMLFPADDRHHLPTHAAEVAAIIATGGIVYFGACQMLGLPVMAFLRRKRTPSNG
jgi:putative peptidoglycan lipid II flippase